MAHTSVLSKEVPDIEVIVSAFRIDIYLLYCFYSRFCYHCGSVVDCMVSSMFTIQKLFAGSSLNVSQIVFRATPCFRKKIMLKYK
jgi:hypothetical protein